MSPGLTSALLILVVYAQAATHGIRLTARMLSALLISAFAGALLTSVCADALLRPAALTHLLWLVAATISGGLAAAVCAYLGGTHADAADVRPPEGTLPAGALWRLCVCTNFAVMLIALPDPFMPITHVALDLPAVCKAAASGTAAAGGTLVLIASALHGGGRARPTSRHALMTAVVLSMLVAGFAAWLPAGPSLALQLPEATPTELTPSSAP